MPKKPKEKSNVSLQLKGIEVIHSIFSAPSDLQEQAAKDLPVSFELDFEGRLNINDELFFVTAGIDIIQSVTKQPYGSIKVRYTFLLKGLQNVIQIEEGGASRMPDVLMNSVTAIAISTTRGIIYEKLRGTFLHHAILPVIDPNDIINKTPRIQQEKS